MGSAQAWTLLAALAVSLLLVATWRHSAFWTAAFKGLAAASFVLVGLARSTGSPFDVVLCWGLAFAALGDLLLLSRRRFLLGLIAFLLAHLLYLRAFSLLLPSRDWPLWLLLPVAASSVGALSLLWRHLGRLRAPVIAYVIVITAMVWGAAAAVRLDVAPLRLGFGAGLFYLSDLAVARQRFVAEWLGNRLLGLPAYFAGQLLVAWSIGL